MRCRAGEAFSARYFPANSAPREHGGDIAPSEKSGIAAVHGDGQEHLLQVRPMVLRVAVPNRHGRCPGATCRRKRRIITCVSRVPSHSGSRLSGISGCQGTYTPESSNMLDTQAGAPRHRAGVGCGLDPPVRWAIGSPCSRHTAPPGRSQPQQKAHARKNP